MSATVPGSANEAPKTEAAGTTAARVGNLLVVDDERSIRDFLRIYLTRAGHRVTLAEDVAHARAELAKQEFDTVITDLKLPDGSGLDVLEAVKRRAADTEVIMVTAFATTETAIEAMKRGAYDYLTKPFKVDELAVVIERCLEKRALKRENVSLREELRGRFKLDRIVGKGESMQRVFSLIQRVAPTKTTVLIQGESGTGKELVARALHQLAGAPRSDGKFVAVNVGAIPDTLLESELFGHVKGAFTGAEHEKKGLFEVAVGGTLFLDEIGEMSGPMQVKLLRALQERTIKPVGATQEKPIEVRVVAATHRDLEAEVERGTFRRDLYYRLNVIELHLPPLRNRREDIPLLAEHFLRKHAASIGRPIENFDPEALKRLCDYDYPGNVRELENLIERAVTLEPGNRISVESLPDLSPKRRAPVASSSQPEFGEDGVDIDAAIGEVERELLLKALEQAGGIRKRAAKLLRITFRSMRYRLAKHGIEVPGSDDD